MDDDLCLIIIIIFTIKMFPNSHRNHYDTNCWTLQNVGDFQAAFRMTLLYLELDHEQALDQGEFNPNGKK